MGAGLSEEQARHQATPFLFFQKKREYLSDLQHQMAENLERRETGLTEDTTERSRVTDEQRAHQEHLQQIRERKLQQLK